MYKIFDYLCPACKTKEERMIASLDEAQLCLCGIIMERLISAPRLAETIIQRLERNGRPVPRDTIPPKSDRWV